MALFQRSVLEKCLRQQDTARMAKGFAAFKVHFDGAAIESNIRESNE